MTSGSFSQHRGLSLVLPKSLQWCVTVTALRDSLPASVAERDWELQGDATKTRRTHTHTHTATHMRTHTQRCSSTLTPIHEPLTSRPPGHWHWVTVGIFQCSLSTLSKAQPLSSGLSIVACQFGWPGLNGFIPSVTCCNCGCESITNCCWRYPADRRWHLQSL